MIIYAGGNICVSKETKLPMDDFPIRSFNKLIFISLHLLIRQNHMYLYPEQS